MHIDEILSEIVIDEGVFRPDEGSIEPAKTALFIHRKVFRIMCWQRIYFSGSVS